MDCEFSKRERTREEEDELQRSTKKVKESMGTSEFGSPPSYRDKLMGEILGAFAQAFNLSTNNEGASSEPVDLADVAKDMIAMTLNPETRRSIRARWTHAIIVKVFGQMVGFHFLHAKVRNLWKPVGRLDCVVLGKDFFLIKFGLIEDYDNVIRGGPWFVGGHFLTIRA